jgi:spore cortex formation protein SpoVR/YcgB (stage V sporulation)
MLQHRVLNGVLLEEDDAENVLQHIADLWGYDVRLIEIDETENEVLAEHDASPRRHFG